MTDKIVNFYNYANNKHKLKFPDGYKNHHIKPNSRTGTFSNMVITLSILLS